MLCWLIRAASPVKDPKVLEIVTLYIFLLSLQIIQRLCFFICLFMWQGSCCPCNFKNLSRHEGGSAHSLAKTSECSEPVCTEREGICLQTQPGDEAASGW